MGYSSEETGEPPKHEQQAAAAMNNYDEYSPPDDMVLPVRERKIRDVFFLILYVTFIVSLIGLVIYAATKGDVDRLIHGVDKYGNVCGKTNPQIEGVASSGQDMHLKPYAEPTRDQAIGGTYYQCTEQCSQNATALFYRCIPGQLAKLAATVGEVVSEVTTSSFLKEAVEDIEVCWREIIYLCLIATGLSVIITFFLRYVAGLIIWLSIGLAVVASIAGTCYLWYMWYTSKKVVSELSDVDPYKSGYKTTVQNWLIYAILATVGTVILLLIVLVMRNRIRLVIALFEEAGKAVTAMPLLLIQPFWTFLVLVIICSTWVYGLLWIESAGTPEVASNGLVYYVKDGAMLFVRWYHVFGLLWATQFCLACQDYVIGGAVSDWYFTRVKSQLDSPITTSISRLLRFHIGSIALGSLIIAIIKAIRLLFKYLERKLSAHSNGSCARCIMCVVQCILYCFENFLKYLSRNAYIEIAIFGSSFCEGAKRAFQIITNNALRVAAINSVGDFTLMLSKLGVTVAVIFIGIELITIKGGVHHIWVPVLLCALFALLISHCFLTVYEMSIDTLLVCFCEDCDLNDGITRPYYMNSSLMKFVKDSRRELAKLSSKNKHKIEPAPPEGAGIFSTHTIT